MALVFHPTQLVFPGKKPRAYHGREPNGIGYYSNPQTGLRVFMHFDESVGADGEWTSVAARADQPCPFPVVGGRKTRFLGLYAGRPVYGSQVGLSDARYVFYSIVQRTWVVTNKFREPRCWADSLGDLHGDGWFEFGGFDPTSVSGTMAAAAHGTWGDLDDIFVEIRWPRFVWNEEASGSSRWPFGIHDPVDMEGDDRYKRLVVGCERWRDNSRNYWIRSLDGLSISCAERGLVLSQNLAAGAWVTQNVFSQTGTWYRSASEPNRSDGAILEPRKIVGGEEIDDADTPAITLTFVDFVSSGETEPFYMSEVSLWR